MSVKKCWGTKYIDNHNTHAPFHLNNYRGPNWFLEGLMFLSLCLEVKKQWIKYSSSLVLSRSEKMKQKICEHLSNPCINQCAFMPQSFELFFIYKCVIRHELIN